MEIKNTEVYGLKESIIRSGYPMRQDNPSDYKILKAPKEEAVLRANKLAKTKGGSGHNNFLKGIIVQADIKYPQYFTPQLQRYNFIDIVSSQSKMHRLTYCDNVEEQCNKYVFAEIAEIVDDLIDVYNEFDENTKSVKIWNGAEIKSRQECFQYIISNLPMGYELWMGISTNYLQLKTVYNQRKTHRLEEWREFCLWIEGLPMSHLITGKECL
jgi:hypothetical protein